MGFSRTCGHLTRFRTRTRSLFFALVVGLVSGIVCAQGRPVPPSQTSATPFHEEAIKNVAEACVEPAPMVRLEDYDGPLKKMLGTFARPLERKSLIPAHYKPGANLCTLQLKDKFALFVQDSSDPMTFLGAGFDAGIDQAENTDPTFGQGSKGYGKRFGVEFADQASSRFFKDFAYPSLFLEDPRYYRLAHGNAGRRLLHAVEHVIVAHRDDGTRIFNFSEWLGTSSTVVLSNTYHPDNRRGFASAAQRMGYSFLQDMGFDVLREFWPEISRKFRLPFRGQSVPLSDDLDPAIQ
jgi:hypothetical protein